MKAKFYTPALTALRADGGLDIEGNKRLYDWILDGNMTGIILLGSMGEFFALSNEWKRELIALAAGYLKGRTRLLVGTGGTCAGDTVSLSRFAAAQGADGVMIVPPYYFSLSEEQAESYFDLVLPQITCPVYLYNFPDVTGYDLSPELTLRLRKKHDNLAGYKDTVVKTDHTARLVQVVKGEFPDFEILCGFDQNFVHSVLSGADGCVGGMSNIIPKECGAWLRAVEGDNLEEMARYQRMMDRIVTLGTVGAPFPPIVKAAAIKRGLSIEPTCAPPFSPPAPEALCKITGILRDAWVLG